MEFIWVYIPVFIILMVVHAQYMKKRAEEEEMNPDLDLTGGDWEYKMLWGTARTAYRDPNVMREALDGEAPAGWTLFDKIDDQRLRLKRPVSARTGDAALDFDPYRSVPPKMIADAKAKGRRNLKYMGISFVLAILTGIAIAALV